MGGSFQKNEVTIWERCTGERLGELELTVAQPVVDLVKFPEPDAVVQTFGRVNGGDVTGKY